MNKFLWNILKIALFILTSVDVYASPLVHATLYSSTSAESLKELLVNKYAAEKAGELNLGNRVKGQAYYHFLFDENRKKELFENLQELGEFTWVLSDSERAISDGKMRIILWLSGQKNEQQLQAYQSVGVGFKERRISLNVHAKNLEMTIRKALQQNGEITFYKNQHWQGKKIQVRLKADPKPAEKIRENSHAIWIPLEPQKDSQLQVTSQDFGQFFSSAIKQGSLIFISNPRQGEPWVVAVNPVNQKSLVAAVPPPPQFLKTYLSNPRLYYFKDGKVNFEEFGPLSTDQTAEFDSQAASGKISITRYRANDLSAQASAVVAREKVVTFAFLSYAHWLERPFDQRTGLLLDYTQNFSAESDQSLAQYRLGWVYRFNHQMGQQAAGFFLGPTFKVSRVEAGTASLVGFSGGYEAAFPNWLNAAVEWLPFMRYPKYIELRGDIYPWNLNQYKDVDSRWIQLKGKMFLTQNFYFEGSIQNTIEKFTDTEKFYKASIQFTSFNGGLGYLF